MKQTFCEYSFCHSRVKFESVIQQSNFYSENLKFIQNPCYYIWIKNETLRISNAAHYFYFWIQMKRTLVEPFYTVLFLSKFSCIIKLAFSFQQLIHYGQVRMWSITDAIVVAFHVSLNNTVWYPFKAEVSYLTEVNRQREVCYVFEVAKKLEWLLNHKWTFFGWHTRMLPHFVYIVSIFARIPRIQVLFDFLQLYRDFL